MPASNTSNRLILLVREEFVMYGDEVIHMEEFESQGLSKEKVRQMDGYFSATRLVDFGPIHDN